MVTVPDIHSVNNSPAATIQGEFVWAKY